MKTPTNQKPVMLEVKIKPWNKKEWQLAKEWMDSNTPDYPVKLTISDDQKIATFCFTGWLTKEQHENIFYAKNEAVDEIGVPSLLQPYVYDKNQIYNNPQGTDGYR